MGSRMNKLVISLLTICLLSGCIAKKQPKQLKPSLKDSNLATVPKDLLYKSEPIPDECMKELVPILCGPPAFKEIDLDTFATPKKQIDMDDDEQDEYEWSYIGTLPNGDHLIYGYLWPAYAMGKFTEIAIVRRTGNKLKALGWIAGGDRHATMIAKNCCLVENDIVTYKQHMTTGLLYDLLLNQLPDLKSINDTKNHDELFWGEADYLGYGIFEATVTPQGKIENQRFVSFTLAEGASDDISIQKIPKASLTMGKAMNRILDYYSYLHKQNTFTLAQLNEAMMEACTYAKDEHA